MKSLDNLSDKDRHSARFPTRKRGVERFDLLLDATASLLAEKLDDDISLAQIADRAGVPLTSVYHFFTNRNAAFVALAQRFQVQIHAIGLGELNPVPKTWQEVIESRQRLGARYLNANPAALRLFMGAGVSVEVRNTDLSGNAALARGRTEYLMRTFTIPPMPDFEKRVAISIALMDGIWALSYSIHGYITDEYVTESARSSIMYLRCYLPEYLELRPGLRA